MASRRHVRPEEVQATTPAPAPAAPVESVEVEDVAPVAAPVDPPAPPAEIVTPSPAPPPVSGLVVVRVRGPGSVMVDRMYSAGEEMVLNLTDAQSLGEAVEIVG